MPGSLITPKLVDHFFRHEYSKLVASLSCRVGVRYTEDVEDAAQSALMAALETWPRKGQPDNPSAWLFQVARNHLLGTLRQKNNRGRLLAENVSVDTPTLNSCPEALFEDELPDDLLRILFVCCDPAIPTVSQLVLALKVLCGFDVREISIRLFTTEANVYKRLTRARERLREIQFTPSELTDEEYSSRLPAVHTILYLLFTEGYHSSHAEVAIRRELCAEAIRLTTILVEHPVGETPETNALLALMHLHSARLTARQDASGGLLLLEEQNRAEWNRSEIQLGLEWLAKASHGDIFSRYHAEAGIAAEHCLSPSFEDTRWSRVVELYSMLESIIPSSIHRLNRAVAVAEADGPHAGIAILQDLEPPTWLAGSYLWAAVLADLHRRCGDSKLAQTYRDQACSAAPSEAIRKVLLRRLQI